MYGTNYIYELYINTYTHVVSFVTALHIHMYIFIYKYTHVYIHIRTYTYTDM